MIEIFFSTLRLSTPLIFAAIGGLLCERSGIATICLEGVMLVAAWTAATVAYYTGSPLLALASACTAGALAMGLHAFLSITARADRIISGVAVNILFAGVTPLLTKVFFGSTTSTPSIPMGQRLSPWILVYVALGLPFVVHAYLYFTREGLRIQAAGDGPEALETSGVSPRKVRYGALLLGGALTSLGGIYLSLAHASEFTRDMTAGRGFIALTALIFGKWRPIPTLLACFLFGFTDALQIELQGVSIGSHTFPVQLIQALPYLITLLVLVTFVGHARPPLAIGRRE